MPICRMLTLSLVLCAAVAGCSQGHESVFRHDGGREGEDARPGRDWLVDDAAELLGVDQGVQPVEDGVPQEGLREMAADIETDCPLDLRKVDTPGEVLPDRTQGDMADDVADGSDPLVDLVGTADSSGELPQLDSQDTTDFSAADQQEVVVPPECPATEDLSGVFFSGLVYLDGDSSSDSTYQQSVGQADTPMAGVEVEVLLPGQEWISRTTCMDGTFAFGDLPEGTGISRLALDGYWSSTANAPKRFPEALSEGEVTIVTFGDSIPSFGAQPYFPDRLAELLSPFALVNNLNLAVPGTTTTDWLPQTNRFKDTLLPH